MAGTCRIINLTDDILDESFMRAKSLPTFHGSHRGSQANIVGSIGEVVFEKFLFWHSVDFVDQRHNTKHDYIIGKNLTLDVKTKDRTVAPQIYFDNSVPIYNHEHQRPNYYFFVSLLRDESVRISSIHRFKKAFLLGGIDLETLDREGNHWNAGQVDPSNGTKFWTACINVSIRTLLSCGDMLDIFKNRVE